VLNYDLVTSKACYRLPRRDDMPILVRLAAQRAAERAVEGDAQDRMLQTVKELSRHPDRGTIFLFERGQDLVGYCILVNHWSNAEGGTVIRIDELYLDRDHRDSGIAEDFLELLAKVAPPGTRSIQVDASPKDKGMLAMCERAGFTAGNARTMTLRTLQDPPGKNST
jgi:GNAT superfamily N-acetyltransferase